MLKSIRHAAIAAALLGALQAHAATFNSASLVPLGGGKIGLDGFGRGASSSSLTGVLPESTAAAPAFSQPFFDTWNIGDDAVAPGTYSFSSMVVDVAGSLELDSVTFNSYDAQGVRHTVVFDINAAGTQAVGSGTFTVLGSCPVQSCIWIDLAGSQAPGLGGYSGTTTAALVPEPASGALALLGLAGVGVLIRRRVQG